jgi:ornithine decarboxylase
MTEVQVIPTTIGINTTTRVTEEKRNAYASVNARAALLSVSTSPPEKSCSPLTTAVQPMGLLSPPAEDTTIPGNGPQVFQGHPDIHIRNGIIRAALASDAQKANAEAAFFVADLGQVYKQHLRWKECLPTVEPFYGA